MTDLEACGDITKSMSRHLIKTISILIKQPSFSQCGGSHEPREQVQRQRRASSPPAKALKLVNVPHEDAQRQVDKIMNISSCDEILMPPNLSHMDVPDAPAAIH